MKHTLAAHTESIFSLHFNCTGELLLTGSYDNSAIAWDLATGRHDSTYTDELFRNFVFSSPPSGPLPSPTYAPAHPPPPALPLFLSGTPKHQFEVHSAQVLDVDWKDATTFASCSTDKSIKVCSLTEEVQPIQSFLGHKDEVRPVKARPGATPLRDTVRDAGLAGNSPYYPLIQSLGARISSPHTRPHDTPTPLRF